MPIPPAVIGGLLLIAGIAAIVWGAERFTDGAIRTAARFAVSPFYVGAVVSGFEPENLVTGIAAAMGGLPQIALGTVIGSAVFLLTAALGVALLLVPMDVRIPREGPMAMLASLLLFGVVLWNGGGVSRSEGALLTAVAVGLMVWLYRRSPLFQRVAGSDDESRERPARPSAVAALGLLAVGIAAMVIGAELLVRGARTLVGSAGLSETFLGMVVVGMGESVEETARMVTPARRGHPELAWGNVVGTVVTLLGFNLGVIALIRPLVADPLVLRLHVPYLVGCTILVAAAMLVARRLGRGMGAVAVTLYIAYLALNVPTMWRTP